MSSMDSISRWLQQLQEGERRAVERLWEQYFHRLVALARKNLQDIPRAAADEEDVALSAFNSFCLAAEQGRFPQLEDRDDLWQILVVLTLRKAANLKQYTRAAKRDPQRLHVAVPSREVEDEFNFSDLIAAREPEPALVAEFADNCRTLLSQLDDRQQTIAFHKMDGYTNEEIARRLSCAVTTIERELRLVRKKWRTK